MNAPTINDRRLASLYALSRDVSTSPAERALAAHHAATRAEAIGIDYLTLYPMGLPS